MLVRLSFAVWLLCALSSLGFSTAQNVPVTGFKVNKGPRPMRQNIETMYSKGGAQWEIYIRALIDMYGMSSTNQLSYFQIAGIHGRPFIEWNGAGKRNTNGWQGYCPHGESLFLPWHRPYVALYEQRLVETAVKIANTYPSAHRAAYVAAATTLRSPYWDWAARSTVPAATVPAKLKVRVPNGSGLKTVEVNNPLQGYKFPKAAYNGQLGPFAKDTQIYRCRSPQSYPASANALLAKRPYKSWVYDAFTRSTTFEQFASTSSSGISLEQIHNGIHWDGSCGNQFLNADYSAFDPLFMLHHTNIDRLWTYWQFIKPTQRSLTRSYSGGARWQSPAGATIGPNSPLHPFYASKGVFHTPESVKDIRKFSYTYEGLEYWYKSDPQMQKDSIAIINRLYATGATRPMLRKRDEGDEVTRYFAQVKVDVEQLERPCSIDLYANTTNVGSFIIMGQPATGPFYGKFALDKAADPVELQDTKTGAVVGDLLGSLRVEITKHDGTIIPLESVPSLKLELENVDVIPPESETELPEYHDAEQRVAPKVELSEAEQ